MILTHNKYPTSHIYLQYYNYTSINMILKGEHMKTLVVYYSYEGNCEQIAKHIQSKLNCDVLRIVPEKENIKKSMMRFVWGAKEVFMIKKPKLQPYQINLDEYDQIIFGTPVWFGTYAPAMNTFLSDNKIENKRIGIFICDGNNKQNTFQDFEKALSNNEIISTLELVYPIKNGIKQAYQKVDEWLTTL